MDYYDGNTVTALWNYAQYYTLEDNSFETEFGPSTPGHLNFVSGETGGAISTKPTSAIGNGSGTANSSGSLIANAYPLYDDCVAVAKRTCRAGSPKRPASRCPARTWATCSTPRKSRGVGSRAASLPTSRNAEGKAECRASHTNIGAAKSYSDYVSYHDPFQYYASTANAHHLPPGSLSAIGHTDQANHQYDLSYFLTALDEDNLPAVSFIKPSAYEDGHPGYSDPLDEQRYLVETINAIEQSPEWSSTAIVIEWDDSDGWYDHVMPPIVRLRPRHRTPLTGRASAVPFPARHPRTTNPTAAATARACRCSLSPPGQRKTTSTRRSQTSPRCSGSSRKTGGWVGSAATPPTPKRARWKTRSTSIPTPPARRRSSWTKRPARSISVSPSSEVPGQSTTSTSSSTGAVASTTGNKTRPPTSGPGPVRDVTCTVSPQPHRRVVVSCRFRAALIHGRTAVRFRLVRHGRVLATTRVFLHGDSATATLRLSTAPKGSYILRIALTSTARVLGYVRSVSIR